MNINSTEEERYNELKDRELTIIPWNSNIEINIQDSKETTGKAYRRFAKELGIDNYDFYIEGIDCPVHFSNKAIKESIHQMELQKSYLENLPKLFTVINDVVKNAIMLNVEEYYHPDRKQAKNIECACQYISAFCDENKIYPVHISVMKYTAKYENNTNMYLVITVGKITKKEVPPIRVHPSLNGESVHPWASSFDISLQQFVNYFNEENGSLLKRFPNQMLTPEQIKIKERIIKADAEKQNALTQLRSEMKALKIQEKELLDSLYTYKDMSGNYEPNSKNRLNEIDEVDIDLEER